MFMPSKLKPIPALKKWLIVLLMGWMGLIAGLSLVPDHMFKVIPEDGIVQDVMDEVGASVSPIIQMGHVERRLSIKPVSWIQAAVRSANKPYQRNLLTRFLSSGCYSHGLSRGPPVRFE